MILLPSVAVSGGLRCLWRKRSKFGRSCICRSRSRRERFWRNIFFPLWLCVDCETKPWAFFTVSFPNSLFFLSLFFQQELEISLDGGTWVTDHILSAELLCQSEYYELLPHIYRFSTNLFNVSCSIYFETLIWKNLLHFVIFVMWTSPSCRLVWDAAPWTSPTSASLSSSCALLSLAAVAAVTETQESAWGRTGGRYSGSAGAGLWSCPTPELSRLWKWLRLYGNTPDQEVSLD